MENEWTKESMETRVVQVTWHWSKYIAVCEKALIQKNIYSKVNTIQFIIQWNSMHHAVFYEVYTCAPFLITSRNGIRWRLEVVIKTVISWASFTPDMLASQQQWTGHPYTSHPYSWMYDSLQGFLLQVSTCVYVYVFVPGSFSCYVVRATHRLSAIKL